MTHARIELTLLMTDVFWPKYYEWPDRVIVNDDLQTAYRQLKSITQEVLQTNVQG